MQQSNQTELYFEEPEIDSFVKKLERLYPDTEYVNQLMTHSWGQQVVRFYDLDGNLIKLAPLYDPCISLYLGESDEQISENVFNRTLYGI